MLCTTSITCMATPLPRCCVPPLSLAWLDVDNSLGRTSRKWNSVYNRLRSFPLSLGNQWVDTKIMKLHFSSLIPWTPLFIILWFSFSINKGSDGKWGTWEHLSRDVDTRWTKGWGGTQLDVYAQYIWEWVSYRLSQVLSISWMPGVLSSNGAMEQWKMKTILIFISMCEPLPRLCPLRIHWHH